MLVIYVIITHMDLEKAYDKFDWKALWNVFSVWIDWKVQDEVNYFVRDR